MRVAERKIFAGARLKRLRLRLALSQTQMAAELGVSPSYLNLIERNQRPLTVQVLLKLSSVYGVDVRASFRARRAAALSTALKEVFSDPLLAGEIASPTETIGAGGGCAERRARRDAAARGLARGAGAALRPVAAHGEPGRRPAGAVARLPLDRAAAYFEEAGPWFPELESGGGGAFRAARAARRPGARR